MDTDIKHSRLTEVVLRFDLTTHNEHYQVEVTQDEDLGMLMLLFMMILEIKLLMNKL